eukprot:gene22437-biopygen2735
MQGAPRPSSSACRGLLVLVSLHVLSCLVLSASRSGTKDASEGIIRRLEGPPDPRTEKPMPIIYELQLLPRKRSEQSTNQIPVRHPKAPKKGVAKADSRRPSAFAHTPQGETLKSKTQATARARAGRMAGCASGDAPAAVSSWRAGVGRGGDPPRESAFEGREGLCTT